MSLSNLRYDIHELFVYVFGCSSITIVVDIDLDEGLWILTKPDEDGEDKGFLTDSRMSHFENRNKDFVEKYLDLFLKSLSA